MNMSSSRNKNPLITKQISHYTQSQWKILFFLCLTVIGSAQSIRTEFGKNRIQYHDDFSKWWVYETENFLVYWYGKGRNIAQTAIQIAEKEHPEIQKMVEHRINDKIEIIVYTDVSDLLQSNIGIEETFETKHETTKVIGSRIFVYFTGNHQDLQRKIREGIARVFFNSMYSKGGLQEVVVSDPDLKTPTWYQEGFYSYVKSSWDFLIEDELRDLWYKNPKRNQNFDKFSADRPRVAGHSMWHYLASEYGEGSITTLLYLMRLRNDFEENIEFVFGFKFEYLKRNWQTYYRDIFETEENQFLDFSGTKLNRGFKSYYPVSLLKLSPDAKQLIYATNENGRYDMVLMNLQSGKKQKLFSYGSKNQVQQPDYNYPIVCWHPNNHEITIIYEKRDKIMLRKVALNNFEFIEQDIPEDIGRIYSVDYVTDQEYLFSALINGFSDLIIYGSKYRGYEKITDDFYDDLDASYAQIGAQKGILFSSNRKSSAILPEVLDTILPLSNFDIYFLPIGSDIALNLSNTPNLSERKPRMSGANFISFLESSTGINNRWVINLTTRRKGYDNSNYGRNIISHDAISASSQYVFQVYLNGKYEVFIDTPEYTSSAETYFTTSATSKDESIQETEKLKLPLIPKRESLLQSKFTDPEEIVPLESNPKLRVYRRIKNGTETELNEKIVRFIPALAVASRRQFKLEEFSAKADNEVLFEGLESYTGDQQEIAAQQTGLLIKGVVKDMFEDFSIELGSRIPFDFKGSEFYALFDDKRARIDKRFAIYRKQETENILLNNLLQKQKKTSFLVLHRQSYPFSNYKSIRATGSLRFDKLYLLNSDILSSVTNQFNEQRASLKLEYVYDNTLDIDINLRHGTRYKAYVEFINRFQLEPKQSFDASKGFTAVYGFDARHYIPVIRHSIFALRGAGATSMGSDKMLYYVGGTDGWVTPRFDEEIAVPANQNFAFKTIAPNLRGFNHNIRNGRSFFVSSAELRIPIFKYFSKKELKSKFLRNIQFQAFADLGSAWHGLYPSVENSPINTVILDKTPGVIVTLDLDRNVFVYGYGFGARINLFGYFIRTDYAWGVESGVIGEPKLYFSLGTDF